MDVEHVPLLVGGGALAALVWSRSRDHAAVARGIELPDVPPADVPDVPTTPIAPTPQPAPAPSATVAPLPGRWVWPVPIWRGGRPVISDGFGSPRSGGRRHEGVDIMFGRQPTDTLRAGTPNGAVQHVMPDNMVALAAANGVVWSAGWTARGFTVVIDHTPLAPFATYYTHLALLMVTPTERGKAGQRVRAGQPIGIIGSDPLDAGHLKHLHFALWRGGPGNAIDPAPLMARWDFVDDPRNPPALVARTRRSRIGRSATAAIRTQSGSATCAVAPVCT